MTYLLFVMIFYHIKSFHGDNRKRHRYFATLSGNFERSVLLGYHISKQVEVRVVILSEFVSC